MLTIIQAEDQIKKVLASFNYDYKNKEKKELPVTIAFYTKSLTYVANDIADAEIWIYMWRIKVNANEKTWTTLNPVFPEYFMKLSMDILKYFHGRVLDNGKVMRFQDTDTLTNNERFQHIHKFDLQVDIETQFPKSDIIATPRLEGASLIT